MGFACGDGTAEGADSPNIPPEGLANGSGALLGGGDGGRPGEPKPGELDPAGAPDDCMNMRVNSPGSFFFAAAGAGGGGGGGAACGGGAETGGGDAGVPGRCAALGEGRDGLSAPCPALKKLVNSPGSDAGCAAGAGDEGTGDDGAGGEGGVDGRTSFSAAEVAAINMRVNSPGSAFGGVGFSSNFGSVIFSATGIAGSVSSIGGAFAGAGGAGAGAGAAGEPMPAINMRVNSPGSCFGSGFAAGVGGGGAAAAIGCGAGAA